MKKKDQKIIDSQVKEWFIIMDNQQSGPYTLSELEKNPRFTPDTLVWKKGYKEWTKARFILELRDLFKDKPRDRPVKSPDKKSSIKSDCVQESQAALTLQQDPFQFLLWVILFLIVVFYALYLFMS